MTEKNSHEMTKDETRVDKFYVNMRELTQYIDYINMPSCTYSETQIAIVINTYLSIIMMDMEFVYNYHKKMSKVGKKEIRKDHFQLSNGLDGALITFSNFYASNNDLLPS